MVTTFEKTNATEPEQTLSYFHNAGFYQLEGEDFVKLMRVGLAQNCVLWYQKAWAISLRKLPYDIMTLGSRNRAKTPKV